MPCQKILFHPKKIGIEQIKRNHERRFYHRKTRVDLICKQKVVPVVVKIDLSILCGPIQHLS